VSRVCTVCSHAERELIDRALVGQQPNLHVARRYGVTEQALRRHQAAGHVAVVIAKAQVAAEATSGERLLVQLVELLDEAAGVLERAKSLGDDRLVLAAVREARGVLETLATVQGLVSPDVAMHVNVGQVVVADPDVRRLAVELRERVFASTDRLIDGPR
jgi:hypothetical protein